MKIIKKDLPLRELLEGYSDQGEAGVLTWNGTLDVRPPYQREFVYDLKKSKAVINSILKGMPLGLFYFNENETNYEVLDGQQRIISIARYVLGQYAVSVGDNDRLFSALSKEDQEQVLNYKINVAITQGGTENEVYDWFETINVASVPLTPQELRNAAYTGPWLSAAKYYFSRKNQGAENLARDWVNGQANRQDFLETGLDWISRRQDCTIKEYMSAHRHNENAKELIYYFEKVIHWADGLFHDAPTGYKKYLKQQNWGRLYLDYQDKFYQPHMLCEKIGKLLVDEDVTSKKGILEYVLSGEEKFLNIRAFSEAQAAEAYQKQKGICIKCVRYFQPYEMHADHVIPWSKGGKTEPKNLQMLCADCNGRKSDK